MEKLTPEQVLRLGIFAGCVSRAHDSAVQVMNNDFKVPDKELIDAIASILVVINEMCNSGIVERREINSAYDDEKLRMFGKL